MARGNIGLILATAFVIVDLAVIVMINTNTSTRVTTAPVPLENQFMVTMVLVGAAIIASLAAIFFKFKPVPAC